jgi:hypothetical protein
MPLDKEDVRRIARKWRNVLAGQDWADGFTEDDYDFIAITIQNAIMEALVEDREGR